MAVSFQANEYVYGANQYAYLAWAVAPADASPSPTTQQLESWEVYGVLAGTPTREIGLAQAARPYVLSFRAPERPGKYKILLSSVPMFRDAPFKTGAGYKESFTPHSADRRELSRALLQYQGAMNIVARFEVSAVAIAVDESPRLYLRVNGGVPSAARIDGGLSDKPIVFNWSVGPEFRKSTAHVLYRYRLDPEDDDWGAWTKQQEAHYSFLLKGVHQFRVQAKYSDGTMVLESPPAMFQFTLPKDHVSRPTKETLTKAPFGSAPAGADSIAFGEVYSKSRALVIGMWKFEDAANFPQFDEKKIMSDVTAMTNALRGNGFEVTTLTRERVTREDITSALNTIVDSAGRDDRIFVYFSTHGFADPILPSTGYLATSDCQLRSPTVRCVRLNELQEHADRALDGKRVRQVLFAVDSCFSGLGIVRKAVGVPNLTKLAVPQGAFMLTAGMANQVAQIDPGLGMSTFTHFLADGLSGSADILGNNGLITLSELFVYVQYKVAERTNAQQIPMLGRMKGDGEMLFLPRPR
ncbi:caspase family protein [Chitinimonas sp.]|uniref:caspase family protein n=1 Tax=Chitinimonas sp. TaxID=1934313 RepID=UPI0035ADEADE